MASCGCNSSPCSCSGGSMGVPDVSVQPISTCSCNGSPCTCGCGVQDPCPDMPSLCDLDRRNNVWVDGVVDANGQGGICMLDTMEEYQVINSLHRSQRAHDDLVKVTSNEYLRNLAKTTPLYPTVNEGDQLQKEVNQGTIPFYTQFRGQPPFAQ